MSSIRDSREAINLFNSEIKRTGLYAPGTPLYKRHREYALKYIDPCNRLQPHLNFATKSVREMSDSSHTPNNVMKLTKSLEPQRKFIQIRDIVSKTYRDKVDEYMHHMKDMTLQQVLSNDSSYESLLRGSVERQKTTDRSREIRIICKFSKCF